MHTLRLILILALAVTLPGCRSRTFVSHADHQANLELQLRRAHETKWLGITGGVPVDVTGIFLAEEAINAESLADALTGRGFTKVDVSRSSGTGLLRVSADSPSWTYSPSALSSLIADLCELGYDHDSKLYEWDLEPR